MSERNENNYELEKIVGLNFNSSQSRVLKAILEKGAATFEEICSLTGFCHENPSERAVLYRHLAILKNKGFIKIIDTSKQQVYQSDFLMLKSAIQQIIETTINQLEKKCRVYLRNLELLTKLDHRDIQKIARYIRAKLFGEKCDAVQFSKDPNHAYKILHFKLLRPLRVDDKIRVSIEWDGEFARNPAFFTDMIHKLAHFGCTINVLGPQKNAIRVSTLQVIKQCYERWLDEGHPIDIRLRKHNEKTFQIIAKNREAMLLFVAEKPLFAQYYPYDANPEILLEAINDFDLEFESAVPLTEVEV